MPTDPYESVISGVAAADELDGVTVYHAGTKLTDAGGLVTSGGEGPRNRGPRGGEGPRNAWGRVHGIGDPGGRGSTECLGKGPHNLPIYSIEAWRINKPS